MGWGRIRKATGGDLTLAALSALLMVCAVPRLDLGAIAWIGLVPLLVALDGKTATAGFLLSYVTGIIFFTGLFYWIWQVPGWNLLDGVLTIGVYLPLYIALWGMTVCWIRRKAGVSAALVGPPLW